MELDFDKADKRIAKEREARLKNARRKQLEEKRQKEIADVSRQRIEAKVQERRDVVIRQRAEEQILLERNQGFTLEADLNAKPIVKANSNRVILPTSFLDKLSTQLDNGHGPWTFRITYQGNQTFCCVEEFTAEEGTICIPPVVALSLVRGENVHLLDDQIIHVAYDQLHRHDRVMVKLRPLGDGFHTDGIDSIDVDIKALLLKALRDVLTISTGDSVRIRVDAKSISLRVEQVLPEPAVLLLNTDLEIDILPSENTQNETDRAERRAAFWIERRERALQTATRIPPSVDERSACTIRLRLPDGKMVTRGFVPVETIQGLYMWVFSILGQPPDSASLDDYNFQLRRHDKTVLHRSMETLESVGLSRETLSVEWLTEHAHDETVDQVAEASPMGSDFLRALQEADETFDMMKDETENQEEMQTEESVGADKVQVFTELVERGIPRLQAAHVAQRYANQIQVLSSMGFHDPSVYIQLLDKYQGRLERVVNILAGAD